jgi:energy-coupling factor transporter ATP-binding protein EcfA2
MIEAQHLTKRYGKTIAVDEASFAVRPGRVTGFLGPNGAGKSTTMRMILGLDTPSSGSVLVNGQPYRELTDPLRSVGTLLDAKAIIGGRSRVRPRHHPPRARQPRRVARGGVLRADPRRNRLPRRPVGRHQPRSLT